MEFSLSWVINGSGSVINNPSWSDINLYLNKLKSDGGSLTLEIQNDDQDIGPIFLQLLAENGQYLLMLGENTEDDYIVRTLSKDLTVPEKVWIQGDCWDKRQVTDRYDEVLGVFKTFFMKGDVPPSILSE